MTSARVRVGMNLLFLDPGRLSGTATYSWSLLAELSGRDDLEIVVFVQDGYVPSPELADRCEVEPCPRFGSVVHRVGWEQVRLPSKAEALAIDVMFSPGYVSPLRGDFAKVVTVHDLYYARWPQAIPTMRRWYYRLFIRASVRRCQHIIAVSASTRDDLAEVLPASTGKTTVVHEAARAELPTTTAVLPTVTGPYFLVVASVTHNKNVETVVIAARELRRLGIDASVVFVGEDPYGILARVIDEYDAYDGVAVIGEVTDPELAGYYRAAAAVIHPSRYEGFGLPALEAQAMGTPLISSRGGALPEVVGDGALFFDHEKPAELVSAMRRLLDEPGLGPQLVEAGRQNLERFSWSDAAQATAAVLRRAAQDPR